MESKRTKLKYIFRKGYISKDCKPAMSEITEFEWYLRDHLFRQFNQGRQKFQKQQIGKEMSNLCLRYKNSDLEKLNKLVDIIIENLISRQVLQRVTTDGSLQLTSRLSRLQCVKCYYISYLVNNESRKCLRCSSSELRDFPGTNTHHKVA